MEKNAKNSSEYEPTLLDVLGAVQTGFVKMEEKMEEKFDDLGYRVTAVEKRVGAVEVTLEEMKGTLDGIAKAVDKDAEAIVNHENRISQLEKLNSIVSVPVKHLANLEI